MLGAQRVGVVCLLAALALGLAAGNAHMERVEQEFDAKPNGQNSEAAVSMKDDQGKDMTCTFKFAVVGGTNEGWLMSIEKRDGHYVCTIERPEQKSYLFFMHFSVEFTAAANLEHVEIYDNSSPLENGKHFAVEGQTVKHIDGAFESSLSQLVLVA